MLTILTTTEEKSAVEQAIRSVDRLDELVTVTNTAATVADAKTLVIREGEIISPFDWYDLEPPYVLPHFPFSEKNLMALTFFRLGNHQKAFEYLEEGTPLFHHLLIATHLQFGYEISAEMIDFSQKTSAHNSAIIGYYGNINDQPTYPEMKAAFEKAIDKADNDEIKLFSVKHYLNLLLDAGDLAAAKQIIEKNQKLAISDDAKFALQIQLTTILKEELKLPYQKEELEKILNLQLEAIAHFESKGLKTQAGLLLVDAAEIANFKEDFITSKDLINKAIQYFREEDIPEFLGEAGLKKAILLYTWSKNGSPQYYKAAINAFQDVLKIFKRDTHPQKFADVHHNLALIYSEIPVGTEEKPMWTAFCASSFKEVLAYYTKEKYPYEHAMASHNYATALMDFPPAKIHDNLAKATELFETALEVRTADAYPFERALTLLNQLELGWLTHNENQADELKKHGEMMSKAEEVKTLVTDPALLEKADEHLEKLEKVRALI
ncbi:MAG: hypothetical protein WBG42_06690 [Cryomorphaceae bacterium]